MTNIAYIAYKWMLLRRDCRLFRQLHLGTAILCLRNHRFSGDLQTHLIYLIHFEWTMCPLQIVKSLPCVVICAGGLPSALPLNVGACAWLWRMRLYQIIGYGGVPAYIRWHGLSRSFHAFSISSCFFRRRKLSTPNQSPSLQTAGTGIVLSVVYMEMK